MNLKSPSGRMIVATINKLESMPFPGHLGHAAEIAVSHGLRRMVKTTNLLNQDQMSIQARAMCIADVAETLTARNRSCKKDKT